MMPIYKLRNVIQPYAWGSRTALAELLGQPVPSQAPQAELWMGAHPKAPSRIWHAGDWQNLDQMSRQYPDFFLGETVARRFANRFPFLFKVLAVEQPLSIQAHPNAQQARSGFERENRLGIALSAPHRNYKDDQHKPECVCALSAFSALCGFRSASDILAKLRLVWPEDFPEPLSLLMDFPEPAAIRAFFHRLMTQPESSVRALVAQVVAKAEAFSTSDPVFDWMVRLNDFYPGDVGVLSPAILNFITLQSGEALYLPSGQLHAYLSGVAVEVMANSDNVLRGGLTAKHVDVCELFEVLDFAPRPVNVLCPVVMEEGWRQYEVNAAEFALSRVVLKPGRPCHAAADRLGPQIILCTHGKAEILWTGADSPMTIAQGESVLITPALPDYCISGQADLYRAAVGRCG